MTETVARPEGSDSSLQISSSNFARIADYITREVGIKMHASKVPMIQSRLLRRVRELELTSIDEYCQHLFATENFEHERTHFVNAVTTNKTDFFREPNHFRYLTEAILPQFERVGILGPNKRLSVWTAACSSGEEPYTLAMILKDYTETRCPFNFRILATDISTRVLQIGKEGIYDRQRIDPIPDAFRRKYLLEKADKHSPVRIVPSLRRLISFHQLNFMDEHYRVDEKFEIIFCRNVLIYFDRPTQETVINKLCRSLAPGGYLFISHSESLSGLNVPLISAGASCYRKQGGLDGTQKRGL